MGRSTSREGDRLVRRAGGLVGGDLLGVAQGEVDVVEPLEQPPAGVVVDRERDREVLGGDRLRLQVDGQLEAGALLDLLPQQLDVGLLDGRGQQARLRAVALEDVAEARRDHRAEPEVHQRPDGVLARGAGAEVRARDEHAAAREGLDVEHEGRVRAPGGEQAVLEAGARDPLEVDGGDDLVGVDVATRAAACRCRCGW